MPIEKKCNTISTLPVNILYYMNDKHDIHDIHC